jgi:hypothetical protein
VFCGTSFRSLLDAEADSFDFLSQNCDFNFMPGLEILEYGRGDWEMIARLKVLPEGTEENYKKISQK